MLIALQLFGALVLVVLASDAFTNAVEWLGVMFGLTRSAVGAVIAAIGSSLPETMVAIIALLFLRDAQSQAIGIGAVLGAPFMLSTMVFFLIGITALLRQRGPKRTLHVSVNDTLFGAILFALTFALALGASFVALRGVHIAAAVLVLLSYGLYLVYHLRRKKVEGEESPPPLRFAPNRRRPSRIAVVAQLVVALAVTIVATRWFVASIGQASTALSISPFLVSLFLAPIATELPDASNVVLWMRRQQDELALGNVLGAMMFQTSIASAIAMVATPWQLGASAYIPSLIALVSALVLVATILIRRRVEPVILLGAGGLYLAYVLYAVVVTRFAS